MPRVGRFAAASATLAAVSLLFYWRQNFHGQIGGAMSLPKLLWLDYALISWFILPAFLCRSPLLEPSFRRLFAIHLINFSARGLVELYLLYVAIGWSPLYGIAHDVFSIALITLFSPSHGSDAISRAAAHFSWSLRLALCAEIVFAAMFHGVTAGERAIYFASNDTRFATINTLTTIVVTIAWVDLIRVVDALRPPPSHNIAQGVAHA